MIGTTLSHYKIVAEIGRGGMGVVYKAEDTKLKRTVALKLLPLSTLGNEDDRARFFREAQAAAQLQHANIATVYAIEEATSDGKADQPFIAMEYIEGETLTERIAQGPMQLKNVVNIATQVAHALEAAHEKNIVHRDVKSGNVMLTKKGVAKVLDFGLAKTSQSTKLTQMGSTLGTIAYMSPEQARGEEVDLRSDIWSLGVLIYEMIASRLPFASEYEQAAVYSILNEEPEPLTAIRSGIPMGLEWIVLKMLGKNAKDRYQNVSDLLVDLRNVNLDAMGVSRVTKPASGSVSTQETVDKGTKSNKLGYAIAAALGAGLMFLIWMFLPGPDETGSRSPTIRISHALPTARRPDVVDISHEGTKVAYMLDRIHILDLSTGRSHELEGTENTIVVDFSPDDEWLLLTKTVSIERIPVAGGRPVTVFNSTEGGPRASWGPDGWIVFEDNQNVYKYSESLSEVVAVSNLDSLAGEQDVDWPTMLPDGKTVMATLEKGELDPRQVRFWDFETGEVLKTINFPGYRVTYLPTGHLAGSVGSEGWAIVPFDIKALEITGARTPLIANVGAHGISVSDNGTVVYIDEVAADASIPPSIPTILQFPQYRQPLPLEAGFYSNVELSPDETKLVYLKHEERGLRELRASIWVLDLATQISRPIVESTTWNFGAVTWMPGSDSIAYTRPAADLGPQSIYVAASDGSGSERLLWATRGEIGDIDVSQDGKKVAWVTHAGSNWGVLAVLDVESRVITNPAGLDISANIRQPRISPDGKSIAYKLNESVFVSPTSGTGNTFNISFGFAQFPLWSSDQKYFFETIFSGSIQRFELAMSPTRFSVGDGFDEVAIIGDPVPYLDIFDDGQRAIVPEIIDRTAGADSLNKSSISLHFVFNLFEELKK